MIQKGTNLRVIDNSGAKRVACIHVCGGYRKRYARIGDLIKVSVKTVKSKRRENSKIQAGDVVTALVVSTKVSKPSYSGSLLGFYENQVVLLNDKNKALGTRIFGYLLKDFRHTRFLKLMSLASGILK